MGCLIHVSDFVLALPYWFQAVENGLIPPNGNIIVSIKSKNFKKIRGNISVLILSF